VDDLSLEFEPLDRLAEGKFDRRIRIVINGEQLPEVFAPCAMLRAIVQSGRYPLFTCTCGIFGCGGYWVDVECSMDAWIWRNGYYPADEDEPEEQSLLYKFEYRIPWSQVQTAIVEIRDAILTLREKQSNLLFLSAACEKAFLDHGRLPGRSRS
jgi:hypothetical protein